MLFFDIAGPDSEALRAFYSRIFSFAIDAQGRFEVPATAPIGAAIRQDPAEMRLYFGVTDVSATLKQIEALGGSIDAPRFEVPGQVVLGLFRDPAGNPFGLVETEGEAPTVP
jgi:predicted enzyme related to lactoylglutathione lyase